MALSKITNAVISASNENTLALANFNFDFSLVKLDAPAEFAPLGSALTVQRRVAAEDGPVHQVVRRLGALFEQLLPSTPKLTKAYGTRASEIIQSPGVNPKGSHADGPFESYVGADGTSIWAAATSGPASIGVMLLANILARKFDDSKLSTAIWVQLVYERQEEIKQLLEAGHIVSASSAMAARRALSRDDLKSFDASARAWLSSADSAKQFQQHQLMLILKNIPGWVNTGSSTYSKVIMAWKAAMQGLEDILNNKPQQISDGAILLAISAWHLYPDLIVLRSKTTKVSFRDPLIPPAAVITVGLDSMEADIDLGIRWSLTLSHLRHYGDPVRIDTCEDNTRITMSQLNVVGFGAFMRTWGLAPKSFQTAAELITSVWNCLLKGSSKEALFQSFPWLYWAAESACCVLLLLKSNADSANMLLGFGSRRGAEFLGTEKVQNLPAFGLCNDIVLHALSADSVAECGIHYLRQFTKSLSLTGSETFIVYSETFDNATYTVVASANPLPSMDAKRSRDGLEKTSPKYFRWISRRPLGSSQIPTKRFYDIKPAKPYDPSDDPHILQWQTELSTRLAALNAEEELLVLLEVQPFFDDNKMNWIGYPPENQIVLQEPYAKGHPQPESSSGFVRLLGHETSVALFIKSEAKTQIDVLRERCRQIQNSTISTQSAGQFLKTNVNSDVLNAYFRSRQISGSQNPFQEGVFKMMGSSPVIDNSKVSSLEALAIASVIYAQFPSATIPIKIASTPITQGKWPPSRSRYASGDILNLISRSEAFSCIVMLESGGINIAPEQLDRVIAVSAQNSIYVAGVLLSDPTNKLPLASMKRVVGNIGAPGVSLLVVPENPRVRPRSDDFSAVRHIGHDGNREDKFQGTSLHLSFTGWKLPIVWVPEDYFDQDIHFLGSVVSVRDHGTWVADIDVLASLPHVLNSSLQGTRKIFCSCPRPYRPLEGDWVSIDNWNELLDIPQTAAIVRSYANWSARLAVSSVLHQVHPYRRAILVEEQNRCWKCFETPQARVLELPDAILID